MELILQFSGYICYCYGAHSVGCFRWIRCSISTRDGKVNDNLERSWNFYSYECDLLLFVYINAVHIK